jgi:cell division protein FtsZ
MAINLVPVMPFNTNIKIIGVGGGGGNAINTMIKKNIENVEFIVANTDMQDLEKSLAVTRLQLGKKVTKGLGTGANPEFGRESAQESLEDIDQLLENANMLFIAAGMGGGTGTGAAPVIAARAREKGILTLGIVTFPFKWEGRQRHENAINGLIELEKNVDTLIVIPNDKVSQLFGRMPLMEAFNKCDEVLANAAQSVSDIINNSGYINVDFADVKAIMSNRGYALMGSGIASGEGKALKAAELASQNPLLSHVSLENCKGLLINVTTGYDFMMEELDDIVNSITAVSGQAGNIITGIINDPDLNDTIKVTVIATGISYDDVNFLKLISADSKLNFGASTTTNKPAQTVSSIPVNPTPQKSYESESFNTQPVNSQPTTPSPLTIGQGSNQARPLTVGNQTSGMSATPMQSTIPVNPNQNSNQGINVTSNPSLTPGNQSNTLDFNSYTKPNPYTNSAIEKAEPPSFIKKFLD